MVNSFMKVVPVRDADFMRFAHSNSAPCCVCGDEPFTELHHFGNEGGKGMKPSDYKIARLCRKCHHENDFKENALRKTGKESLLAVFALDALALHEEWLVHLSETKKKYPPRCSSCSCFHGGKCTATFQHIEPMADCAMDSLREKVYQVGSLEIDADVRWFVEWSNQRSANVIGDLIEAMEQIKKSDNINDAKFIVRRTMRACGIERIES